MAILKALPGAPDFKALPGSAKVNGEPVKRKLIQIKRSVINLDKFFSKRNEAAKKQNEIFRKQKQNFKRRNKEDKLEKPKQEWKKIIPKKVPGLSFFDSIRKFVVGWIVGFVAIKLIPLLPKLIPVILQLGKVVNWFINIGGAFLSGIISFVDFGIKAQEKTYGFIKSIGGEGVANALAGFAKAFGTALDLMLLVGGLTIAEAMSGDSGLGSLFGGGPKPKGPANNIRKFSRAGALSKTATKTGGRFGRSALTNLGRKGLVKVLGKGGTKTFLKLTKNFISPIIKRIPLIGALADFALNVFVFKESPGKSAFKAIGAGLGAWLVGALASIVPGAGTLIGAVLGGLAGDALGGLIYDMVFDEKDNTSSRPEERKKDKKDKGVIGSTVTGGVAGTSRVLKTGTKKLAKETVETGTKKLAKETVEAGAKKVAQEGGEKLLKGGTKKVVKAGAKAALKSSKNLISPIVKKIPFIGALLDFALNYFVFKEPLGRSAFMAIGAGVGAWLGGLLGTFFGPGLGTAIGAFAGGIGGDMLGGAIYDMVFGGKTEKATSEPESALSTSESGKKISETKSKVSDKPQGIMRGIAGAADFATFGMFDFDKQNREGAPKDSGIRRIAGGLADYATFGLTDFDKRGAGVMQFDPISGGKDKAWGAANEQAKRGEKQSGMGIKRGIGGALDFATFGMFDFDKQNRKGAPKGFGIKRIVGGLADFVTAGATDFDKRGTGIGQMNLGEKMSKKKAYEKYLNSDSYKNRRRNITNLTTHPLDRKMVFGNVNDGKPISQRELYALAKSGDPEAIKIVEGMKQMDTGEGSYTWNKETTFSNNQGSTTSKESYSSDTGDESTDLKLGKQLVKFDEELLGISASYEADGSQKEYTIYAPTTQINMLPGNNSGQVVTSGASGSSEDPYEILEKG